VTSSEPANPLHRIHCVGIPARDYNLALTLDSGQVFRWVRKPDGWEGVVGHRWVRLEQQPQLIHAVTVGPPDDWSWLHHYLQTQVSIRHILASFPPDDPHLRAATDACRGLRVLRQDPWECLAAFILSSTKQITQIHQIIGLLCQRFGQPVPTPHGQPPARAFPAPAILAALTEADIRACKAGFRSFPLWNAARRIADGSLDLDQLGALPTPMARERLMELRGVGEKIANCVLLFAYGKPDAFPVDVWIQRALRRLYFPSSHPKPAELRRFIDTHFGPQAGYAQQYLFHYMRVHLRSGLGNLNQTRHPEPRP
jgi:N-glycosylase/DNA lyase